MGVKALKIGDLEREVAVKIRDAVDAAGWTPAQLAREASITKARVYTLLDSESPMTITTFAAMCRALGLTASEVVREAEEAVARAGDAVVGEPVPDDAAAAKVVPLRPAEADDVPEPVWERMAAKMHQGRAREIAERTGWREDLGEESQVNPDWEE